MDLGRDVKRLLGREPRTAPAGKVDLWADPAALELLPLMLLKREAVAAGLAAAQADRRERDARRLAYAVMLGEIARRTGEPEALAKAASAAERAARESNGPALVAARLERVAIARLTAELFADKDADAAASEWMTAAEQGGPAGTELEARRFAAGVELEAAAALAAGDLDGAVQAAGLFDEALERLEAVARPPGSAQPEMIALRRQRADFLIGFGLRLKDKALLIQAEKDLATLSQRLDPDYLPLSWARVESLRAAALAAIGDLAGDPRRLAESVKVYAAAAEQVGFDHSPLDRGRISHGLGLALQALAEATDEDDLYDHALSAFDQASAVLDGGQALAIRAMVAHDRADCVARRAERQGDAAALARAEAAFRAELTRQNPVADPVAWAVAQLALTRVYLAQSTLLGASAPPPEAAVALTEAFDVFAEHGLKTLAEAAKDGLERLLAVQG